MICKFEICGEKNGKPTCCCKVCGNTLYESDPERCYAECAGGFSEIDHKQLALRNYRNSLTCIHLLRPTEDSVTIAKLPGCGGCSQTEATIWECELYEDCAPLAIGIITDGAVHDCRTCRDYQAKPVESVA